MRVGLAKTPESFEVCAFWIEDPQGDRVLVRAEQLDVAVRADRAEQLVEVAEADIEQVSQRIRELKDVTRAGGPGQAEANRERRRLAKVATLLCAIRAEARGNVHVGGTLEGQRRWIESNAGLAGDGLGERTVQRRVERFEVLLQDGDPAEVEGWLRREPRPAELGGGYCDRSDCLVVVPAPDGVVRVRGVGVAAPVSERELRGEPEPAKAQPTPASRSRVDPIVVWTLMLVLTALALAYASR